MSVPTGDGPLGTRATSTISALETMSWGEIVAAHREGCSMALRGEAVPSSEAFSTPSSKAFSIPTNLTRHKEVATHLSTVMGIRHHLKFALSEDVRTLCANEAVYARARNARLIMSNIIPDMESDDHKPYCIWYPDFASKDTYRELARRYPDMRYHVARACAAAGYDDLYQELEPQLLPDVCVAEEARDTVREAQGETADAASAERALGAGRIFDSIVSQQTRYNVMNDYTRTVNLDNPSRGAYLNGDTAVRSSLNTGLPVDYIICGGLTTASPYSASPYFDITEDGGICEEKRYDGPPPLTEEEVPLLYKPLPLDLSTTNKDPLILMAAYEGNIDRYARLRRPLGFWAPHELQAVVRGIYHHTTFAKWWATQEPSLYDPSGLPNRYLPFQHTPISQAITARFIMNNDLSRIEEDSRRQVPLLISWPLIPRPETLERLLELKTQETRVPVGVAAIRGDYHDLFAKMKLNPHSLLWRAAKNSPNPEYCKYFEARAAELGMRVEADNELDMRPYNNYGTSEHNDMEQTAFFEDDEGEIAMNDGEMTMYYMDAEGIYPGADQTNLAYWENFICRFKEQQKN